MKELSIQEKAQRYDKAIEIARYYYNDRAMPIGTNFKIERMFPELIENEDEVMRAMAIKAVYAPETQSCIKSWGINPDDVVAWLEKQGEKKHVEKYNITGIGSKNAQGKLGEMIKNLKSADKVEPKFHEGEWITNGDYTWKIVEVKPLDYILQSQDGNIVDDTISYVDEQFHSFTIEDAKTGDVLASELCDSIILFKGINDDNNIDFYCDYDFYETDVPGDRFSVNNGQHYGNVEDSKDFHPATKEQRDILMKAMADAGYAFDFKKLELKKIVVPIFNIGDTIVEKDLDECSYGTIKDIKNGQYIFTDGSSINIDEQEEWQLKTSTNIERKPADWGREDEQNLNGALGYIRDEYLCRWLKDVIYNKYEKPADWSEEDEKMLNQIISIIEDADDYLIRAENISIYTNWLKSLKHKYHIH